MEEVSQKWKGTCPTLLSIAVIHSITKSSMGTKGLLWLIGYHQGKPGQELKAGTGRQKLKRDHGRMLLTHGRMACSSSSAHLPFLSNPGLLAQRLHCSQWFAHCLAH